MLFLLKTRVAILFIHVISLEDIRFYRNCNVWKASLSFWTFLCCPISTFLEVDKNQMDNFKLSILKAKIFQVFFYFLSERIHFYFFIAKLFLETSNINIVYIYFQHSAKCIRQILCNLLLFPFPSERSERGKIGKSCWYLKVNLSTSNKDEWRDRPEKLKKSNFK